MQNEFERQIFMISQCSQPRLANLRLPFKIIFENSQAHWMMNLDPTDSDRDASGSLRDQMASRRGEGLSHDGKRRLRGIRRRYPAR